SDYQRDDLLTADRSSGIELVTVQQGHEALEAGALALMRRGRQQQQVGCGFRESLSQTVPGDLFGAATEPAGLIADNQIPPGVDEVTEAFLIVGFQLLLRPTSPLLKWLDGIDRAPHLIELPPDVLGAGEVAPQRKLTWREEPELLAEVRL